MSVKLIQIRFLHTTTVSSQRASKSKSALPTLGKYYKNVHAWLGFKPYTSTSFFLLISKLHNKATLKQLWSIHYTYLNLHFGFRVMCRWNFSLSYQVLCSISCMFHLGLSKILDFFNGVILIHRNQHCYNVVNSLCSKNRCIVILLNLFLDIPNAHLLFKRFNFVHNSCISTMCSKNMFWSSSTCSIWIITFQTICLPFRFFVWTKGKEVSKFSAVMLFKKTIHLFRK